MLAGRLVRHNSLSQVIEEIFKDYVQHCGIREALVLSVLTYLINTRTAIIGAPRVPSRTQGILE